jgi:hypothetical protein
LENPHFGRGKIERKYVGMELRTDFTNSSLPG